MEDRPVPQIREPTDAILRVTSTALCGSDLHFYRGHLKCPKNFICGHEFVGEIVATGSAVKKFKIGEKVSNSTTIQPIDGRLDRARFWQETSFPGQLC